MRQLRRSNERGVADHGWLQSFHSFSFANYYDAHHMQFGALRVINEDRIAKGGGFGRHGHRDMEIISYVLEGALGHQDSLGNQSTIRPGDVQRMSAGTGIEHSEFNHAEQTTHFLQIWITPSVVGIAPSYEQKHLDASLKRGVLRLLASPDGASDSVTIHADARMYAGVFEAGERAILPIAQGRSIYVHLVRGTATVNGEQLQGGDALMLQEEFALEILGDFSCEVLVFDLASI